VRWIWSSSSVFPNLLTLLQAIPGKLSVLRTQNPRRRGFWLALGLSLILAVLFWALEAFVSTQPTRDLLQSLAQIGATLLIAYAVEISWAVKSSSARGADQQWMGFVMGIGAAGLGGIALALALSERLAAGHWIWVDEFLFGWATGSLAVLGCLIVSLPDLTDSWSRQMRRGALDDD
jgi:hypothetical protein